MGSSSFVVDLTDTPTVAGAPLGAMYVTPPDFWHREVDSAGVGNMAQASIGEHEWRYVSTVTDTPAQGLFIRRALGSSTYGSTRLTDVAVANALSHMRVAGCWQWAATAGDFGWVLRAGEGGFRSDGSSTVDVAFLTANDMAAGNARDATAGTNDGGVVGVALDEDGGLAGVYDAWVNCLG